MVQGQGIIIYTGEPLAIGYSYRHPVNKENKIIQNRSGKIAKIIGHIIYKEVQSIDKFSPGVIHPIVNEYEEDAGQYRSGH